MTTAAMTTAPEALLFARDERQFHEPTLKTLVAKANELAAKDAEGKDTGRAIEEIKAYALTHFAKLDEPLCFVARFDADKNHLRPNWVKDTDVKRSIFVKCKVVAQRQVGKRWVNEELFDLAKWFFDDDCTRWTFITNPRAPFTSVNSHGNPCINLCRGMAFRYQQPDQRGDDSKQQAGVALIWDHIKQVICCNDEEMYAYHRAWIVAALNAVRTNTCLYWKSGEGTGKSIITEFLLKIFGPSGTEDVDSNTFTGNDNSPLVGKVFVNLNEPPSENAGAWKSLSDNLKKYITGDSVQTKKKFVSDGAAPNHMNTIITTNKTAIRISADDRRFVCPDISEKRAQEKKSANAGLQAEATAYFDALWGATGNPAVQQTFYNLAVDELKAWVQPFNFTKIPTSSAKQAQTAAVRPLHRTFIIERFLKRNTVGSTAATDKKKQKNTLIRAGKNANCNPRAGGFTWAIHYTQFLEEFCLFANKDPSQLRNSLKADLERDNIEVFEGDNNGLAVDLRGRAAMHDYFKSLGWIFDTDGLDECTCESKGLRQEEGDTPCDLNNCSPDCLACDIKKDALAPSPTAKKQSRKGLGVKKSQRGEDGNFLLQATIDAKERAFSLACEREKEQQIAAFLAANEERLKKGHDNMCF